MQVFNVGVLELLFILVLAFIVLGPKKAITTAGDVGRWIKNLTKSPLWREIITTSNEIREFPKRIMDDVDFQKTMEDLDRSTKEINQVLQQAQIETEGELVKLQQEIDQEIQQKPGKSVAVAEESSSETTD